MVIILCNRCHASIQFNASTPVHTLHSDYIPSDSEIAHVRTLIWEDEDSLKRCHAEINRLRGVVETLEKEKIHLEKRIQQQRALIHPMRRIPVELLEIIFSYSCFDPIRPLLDAQGYDWFPLHAPPLRLSHTSSHWRTVITHCPRLWSTITVSVDGHKHDIRPLLKLYLSNSAGYPLQIEVKALQSCDGPEEALKLMGEHGVNAFRMVFTDMAAQCVQLELFMSWYFFNSANVGHLSPTFTRLRYLQLHTVRSETPEDDDTPELPEDMVSEAVTWFWDALRLRAPNLTRLYTGRMLLAHADPIPYSRLKSLLFAEVNNIARLLHVLESSPSLESLEIWWFQLRGEPESHTMLSLSHLQTLTMTLEDESLNDLSRLWSALNMPALNSFSIKTYDSDLGGFPPSFVSMLSYSNTSLQELRLNMMYKPFPGSSLSSLVRILPNLTLLDVGFRALEGQTGAGSPSLKDLFSKLTVRDPIHGATFAPKLTTLILHESCSRMNIDNVQDCLTLAESRSRDNLMNMRVQGVASLSLIQVTYTHGSGAEKFLAPDYDISHDPTTASRVESLRDRGTICVFKENGKR